MGFWFKSFLEQGLGFGEFLGLRVESAGASSCAGSEELSGIMQVQICLEPFLHAPDTSTLVIGNSVFFGFWGEHR